MLLPLTPGGAYRFGLTSHRCRRHALVEFSGPDARQQLLVEQQPHTTVQAHREIAGCWHKLVVVTAGARAVNLALALGTLPAWVPGAHQYTMIRIIIAHSMMLGGMACSTPMKNFKCSPTDADR